MEPIRITADTQRVNYQNEIKVTQNDTVQFVIKIQQAGEDVPLLPDTIYTLTSLRLDRVAIMSPSLGSVTGTNEVTFDVGTKALEITGLVKASVQMISADGRLSTLSFNYNVVRDLSDAPPSEKDKTLIEVVLGEGPVVIDAAKDATQEALEAAEEARNAATTPGPMGPEGPQGIQGERGAQGLQGPIGLTGPEGKQGPQGERGPGIQGEKGDSGPRGEQGIQGVAGKDGAQGLKGDKGDAGERGLQGVQGNSGKDGAQGIQGIQGPKGDGGVKGDKGDPGQIMDQNTTTGVGEIKIWTGTQAEWDALVTKPEDWLQIVRR